MYFYFFTNKFLFFDSSSFIFKSHITSLNTLLLFVPISQFSSPFTICFPFVNLLQLSIFIFSPNVLNKLFYDSHSDYGHALGIWIKSTPQVRELGSLLRLSCPCSYCSKSLNGYPILSRNGFHKSL